MLDNDLYSPNGAKLQVGLGKLIIFEMLK